MTHILGVVATVYGTYGAIAILMQARQMLTRHGSCDVSLRFLASYVAGYAIWLAYGITSGSLPLTVTDSAGLLCGSVTLAVAVIYHRSCTSAGTETT